MIWNTHMQRHLKNIELLHNYENSQLENKNIDSIIKNKESLKKKIIILKN